LPVSKPNHILKSPKIVRVSYYGKSVSSMVEDKSVVHENVDLPAKL